MVLFWAQVVCRVIYCRLAYFFIIATTNEVWSLARAGCIQEQEMATDDMPLAEGWTFERCEQSFRLATFLDNLTYIFFDTYIATILYKWACLADEEQPEDNKTTKINPEK